MSPRTSPGSCWPRRQASLLSSTLLEVCSRPSRDTECYDRVDGFCILPEYHENEGDRPQMDDDFRPQGSRHGRDEPGEGIQSQLQSISTEQDVYLER